MNYNFIFGLNEIFNNKPFAYFHYLNLKSCYITQNKPNIYVHCIYEPINNEWWEMAKDFIKVIKYKRLPDIVYKCNNKTVWRLEHQSDIFRLLILKEFGGVYADSDTFFYRSFYPKFNNNKFTMGIESYNDNVLITTGLCNALMISNGNTEFIDIWMDSYNENYDDYDWNKMSVRDPYRLSYLYPELIHIEPVESFHKYDWWSYIYSNMIEDGDVGIYSKHMCTSKNYDIFIKFTPEYLKSSNDLFSHMCRNIPNLL
jgi:hypothetical protein